jgi:very-short-patch-repair endonuclease
MREIIPYKPELTEIARLFRNNPTKSEALLWQNLKGRKMCGYDFHRQKPIGSYIVDFYCNDLRLAIEVDGSIHEEEEIIFKDMVRQDNLEDYGIRMLRLKNSEIETDIGQALRKIESVIRQIKNTPPAPSQEGEC